MNLSNDIYFRKYLKYKTKYVEMKGGGWFTDIFFKKKGEKEEEQREEKQREETKTKKKLSYNVVSFIESVKKLISENKQKLEKNEELFNKIINELESNKCRCTKTDETPSEEVTSIIKGIEKLISEYNDEIYCIHSIAKRDLDKETKDLDKEINVLEEDPYVKECLKKIHGIGENTNIFQIDTNLVNQFDQIKRKCKENEKYKKWSDLLDEKEKIIRKINGDTYEKTYKLTQKKNNFIQIIRELKNNKCECTKNE